MNKIASIIDKARIAVAGGDAHFRQAAELIVQALDAGATQAQVAAGIGRSRAWVTYLLAWRKGGYQGAAFDRSNKSRVSSQTGHSEKSKPMGDRERAARAHADAEKAKAQRAKADRRAEQIRATERAKERKHKERISREETKRAQAFGNRGDYGGGPRDGGPANIDEVSRSRLIKLLWKLHTESDSERATAAKMVDGLRVKLGLSWEQLIIRAKGVARAA